MTTSITTELDPLILEALKEIQKSRTRFQLEHFVAGQHDTDQQQYRQVLMEIQSLYYSIQTADLQLQKSRLEIYGLMEKGDPISLIDAKLRQLGIDQGEYVMLGAKKELADLVEMWELFPYKYTSDELEANQAIYWEARLIRQAQLEAIGSGGKIGWGALDALRQINKLNSPEQMAELATELKEIE